MDTALLHALSISRSIKNGKLKRERIVGVKKIDRQTCGREGGWRVLGGGGGGWGRGCVCGGGGGWSAVGDTPGVV